LYPRRSNLRQIIDRKFAEIGITPDVVMEADDTEAIKKLVETGFGYSVLPEHALRQRAGSVFQTFRIDGHRISRQLGLVMMRTDYPRRLTESIANALQNMLGEPNVPGTPPRPAGGTALRPALAVSAKEL
jgi:LysR family nitrogen assimilation transcriptional regulator